MVCCFFVIFGVAVVSFDGLFSILCFVGLFLIYFFTKKRDYLASSVTLVSRITVTFIVPGYCILLSIFSFISLAIL